MGRKDMDSVGVEQGAERARRNGEGETYNETVFKNVVKYAVLALQITLANMGLPALP